jgi:predicted P-loop ATPase
VAQQVPLSAAQALVDELCKLDCKTLYGDFVLVFEQFGAVTVREVFKNPTQYDQKSLADPVEGVGYGKTTAKFFWNNGKSPFINSFAHGGQKYSVRVDATVHMMEEDRHGKFKGTLSNLNLALSDPSICGVEIAYDDFQGCELIRRPATNNNWCPLADFDCTDIAIFLSRHAGFVDVSPNKMSTAIRHYSMQNRIDTAKEWVESLIWDGVSRIDAFMSRYFGAEDCPYSTAVSQYLWTALAGRVLQGGIQADMVPILYGPQGGYKSTGLVAMVPDPKAFCEVNLAERDDNLSRKMVGVMIGELSELRGLKTKDAESIKEFLTRKIERWTPKFIERPIDYPRRSLFIGTTNENEFLADTTGNRRFLPITVTVADRSAIKQDRNQLWAEAVVRFRNEGILYKDAEALAKHEHEKYQMLDVWENTIAKALGYHHQKILFTGITTVDILERYLEIPFSKQNYQYQNRVKGIMKKLGYIQHRTRVDGQRAYRWYPVEAEPLAA